MTITVKYKNGSETHYDVRDFEREGDIVMFTWDPFADGYGRMHRERHIQKKWISLNNPNIVEIIEI